MPSVKYFLNRQPNGFYSGSVLEWVDEKGDPTASNQHCVNDHKYREHRDVVQTNKQSDPLISIHSNTSRPTLHEDPTRSDASIIPKDGPSIPLVLETDVAPPTASPVTEMGKISESFVLYLQAWNDGQELLALHRPLSNDPCLNSRHPTPRRPIREGTPDERSSDVFLNSQILVLYYVLEQTNIASGVRPNLIAPEAFAAFGVSADCSLEQLVQSLDFMSVVAGEGDRPLHLVLWSEDSHHEWSPGEVWTLDRGNREVTLEDIGWKGGVDHHVRVSLLSRQHCLQFQTDVGMWKVG
ncbi:hypothetical protein MMC26_001459 [Xylographa opegraphella]|nr:hypothetical protein [Xylographa opegraphella]